MPLRRTAAVRRALAPVLLRLAGRGPFADLEHRGRRTGRTLHTPLWAWRDDDAVTVVLTYGTRVQWLANVRAAGGARMLVGGRVLTLGPPQVLAPWEGARGTPPPVRWVLRHVVRAPDAVRFPVLAQRPVRRG